MGNLKKEILADVLLSYDVENSLKENEPVSIDNPNGLKEILGEDSAIVIFEKNE